MWTQFVSTSTKVIFLLGLFSLKDFQMARDYRYSSLWTEHHFVSIPPLIFPLSPAAQWSRYSASRTVRSTWQRTPSQLCPSWVAAGGRQVRHRELEERVWVLEVHPIASGGSSEHVLWLADTRGGIHSLVNPRKSVLIQQVHAWIGLKLFIQSHTADSVWYLCAWHRARQIMLFIMEWNRAF